MKQYDAIIIGFGKAGKTLAAELSNRGWQVAVVEQSDEMYGGACPNVACIPTKTLIHESEISTMILISRVTCIGRRLPEKTNLPLF